MAHFFGNVGKAMVVRHAEILWVISIMWEVTEVFDDFDCDYVDIVGFYSFVA